MIAHNFETHYHANFSLSDDNNNYSASPAALERSRLIFFQLGFRF